MSMKIEKLNIKLSRVNFAGSSLGLVMVFVQTTEHINCGNRFY